MTYSFETFPGEPIVLEILTEQYDVRRDSPQAMQEQAELMDGLDEDIYFIVDATALKVDFGNMVGGLAMATRGETAVFLHPRIKKVVIIGSTGLAKMGVEALSQKQYGGLSISLYDTLDEALTDIRSEIAGG